MDWDATPLIIVLLFVNFAVMIRGYVMIVTVLRAMSGHFEEQGGAKFLIAHNALNNISDFLEYRYKALSANEQRDEIVKMIGGYSNKMGNLIEGKQESTPEKTAASK